MRRRRLTLAALVLLTSALAFAADEEGQPAPNFHAKTTAGETYTNATLKGKVVLLQFWTTWCPYCRIVLTEDTNLAAMYQANSYPIYVVIDRDGNIAAEQRGAGGERSIRRMLRKAGVDAEPEKQD